MVTITSAITSLLSTVAKCIVIELYLKTVAVHELRKRQKETVCG